jgi:hypothetical protein
MIVDERHHSLILISRRSITRREFGDWEISHHTGAQNCEGAISHILDLTKDAADNIKQLVSLFMK